MAVVILVVGANVVQVVVVAQAGSLGEGFVVVVGVAQWGRAKQVGGDV